MNKKERKKLYFNFLKKQTDLAREKIDLSIYQFELKKEYSSKALAIKDSIASNFGCNEEEVYNLVTFSFLP